MKTFTICNFAVLFLSFVCVVTAQTCLYNETMCACSFGTSDGSCYQQTNTDENNVTFCSKRTCDAGWTCDCDGDYYCNQEDINVYTLVNANDFALESNVECEITSQRTITNAGFELGYFHPQFSDTGLLDQQCQVFAWWLDGELQNSFGYDTEVTADNLDEVKQSFSDWNQLPLTSGSVIGFRWKNTSFACYNARSELNVNGTIFDTTNASLVNHRYTNNFQDDWFATDFVEDENWTEPFASDLGDTYDSNDGFTNIYWRIQIL